MCPPLQPNSLRTSYRFRNFSIHFAYLFWLLWAGLTLSVRRDIKEPLRPRGWRYPTKHPTLRTCPLNPPQCSHPPTPPLNLGFLLSHVFRCRLQAAAVAAAAAKCCARMPPRRPEAERQGTRIQ